MKYVRKETWSRIKDEITFLCQIMDIKTQKSLCETCDDISESKMSRNLYKNLSFTLSVSEMLRDELRNRIKQNRLNEFQKHRAAEWVMGQVWADLPYYLDLMIKLNGVYYGDEKKHSLTIPDEVGQAVFTKCVFEIYNIIRHLSFLSNGEIPVNPFAYIRAVAEFNLTKKTDVKKHIIDSLENHFNKEKQRYRSAKNN